MSVTNLAGLFETVVSGLTEACQVLAPTHAAKDAIYWDHNPLEPGILYKTLNVALPLDPSANVQDIQSNDMQLTEAGFNTIPMILNRHPQLSIPIRDYDQFQTPLQVKNGFARGVMIAMDNFINGDITALANTANFTTNSAIVCSGGAFSTTQFTGAMAVLADQRVPVENNPQDMTMLMPSVPYYKLTDPATGTTGAAWAQAFIVGNKTAEEIHTTGAVKGAFGVNFRLDQQLPVVGATPSRTWYALLMHRWAIAGVTRPIKSPPAAMKVADTAYIPFGNIQLRVMTGYSFYPKNAEILSVDCAYGLKVVRENMAIPFTISE